MSEESEVGKVVADWQVYDEIYSSRVWPKNYFFSTDGGRHLDREMLIKFLRVYKLADHTHSSQEDIATIANCLAVQDLDAFFALCEVLRKTTRFNIIYNTNHKITIKTKLRKPTPEEMERYKPIRQRTMLAANGKDVIIGFDSSTLSEYFEKLKVS